ncbi:MAG: divalent-cation tolerance protein CutA [Halobacteriaceae archaeon]
MTTAFITAPEGPAEQLAKGIVEEQLAACVNIVDCDSIYWWEDSIENDDEKILYVKTTPELYDNIVSYVEKNHPYDVPCIERFDEIDIYAPYSQWVNDNVQSGS